MKKTVLPVLVLFAVCLCVSGVLGLVNAATAEKIAGTEAAALKEAAKTVLPAAVTLTPIEKDGITGYIGYDGAGNKVGYTFTNAARGYGGDVTAVVGMDLAGNITGISVTAPDETPGLGANVQKDSFLSRFLGKPTGRFTVGENVEAVTSATYSSRAVAEAVNLALDNFAAMQAEDALQG